MATDKREKAREARLRRMAERQRLRLAKSPRRDEHAIGHGTYKIVGPEGETVYGDPEWFGLLLDDVEQWLTTRKEDRE